MKKFLKISTIFLLCIQILNLNIAWAGDEDNTDKIEIVLCGLADDEVFCRRVKVSKKEKFFVLDIFFSQEVTYICSGQILNKNFTFGEIIQDGDIICAFSEREQDMLESFVFPDFDVVKNDMSRLREMRLTDLRLRNIECRHKLYRGCYQQRMSALEKRRDISIPEHDIPTVIPEKPDSISTFPLPIFWPEIVSISFWKDTIFS